MRDDLARFLDDDRIADADVLAANFAQIVQRRMLHRRAGDENRFHVGPRCELTRFADLPIDAEKFCNRLFGRVFVGDAPPWEFAGVAQFFLQVDAIDADNDAVDEVRELVPLGREVFDELPDRIDRLALLREWVCGDAPSGERGQELAVRFKRIAGDFTSSVGDNAEPALGDDARIELLERAGGRIAWVGEGLVAGFDDGSVHPLELGGRHKDFAAHFENSWNRVFRVFVERERDGANGADVLCHVVATLTIAAGGSLNELPALVAKVDRDAIDFGIGKVTAGDGKTAAVGCGEGGFVTFAKLPSFFLNFAAAFSGCFQFVRDG